jgi:Ca2+-binding RTX toxin-like protein
MAAPTHLKTLGLGKAAPHAALPGPAAGSPDAELWVGTKGRDVFNGAGGDDTLSGGKGNDVLAGGDGNDWVDGGQHKDVIVGDAGADTLLGGSGDDFIGVDVGADSIDGGEGVDTLSAKKSDFGVVANMRGSGAGWPSVPANSLTLSNGDVQKLFGAENFIGSKFDDIFHASDASGLQRGGKGRDDLNGGAGNDTLSGDAGDDALDGGGGQGRDYLVGGKGNDNLLGGLGTDTMFGGVGNDTLYASDQNDELYCGEGDDTVWINNGFSNQLIYGEAGRDIFKFGVTEGVIQDFEPGFDICDLRGIIGSRNVTWEELEPLLTETNGDTTLELDLPQHGLMNWTYVFKGVHVGELSESDFLY